MVPFFYAPNGGSDPISDIQLSACHNDLAAQDHSDAGPEVPSGLPRMQ